MHKKIVLIVMLLCIAAVSVYTYVQYTACRTIASSLVDRIKDNGLQENEIDRLIWNAIRDGAIMGGGTLNNPVDVLGNAFRVNIDDELVTVSTERSIVCPFGIYAEEELRDIEYVCEYSLDTQLYAKAVEMAQDTQFADANLSETEAIDVCRTLLVYEGMKRPLVIEGEYDSRTDSRIIAYVAKTANENMYRANVLDRIHRVYRDGTGALVIYTCYSNGAYFGGGVFAFRKIHGRWIVFSSGDIFT